MLEQAGFPALVISDGDLADTNAATGALTFIGGYGTFNLNVVAPVTKPVIGGPNLARFDFSTFNMSSSSGGTLKVTAVDTDFTEPTAGANPLTFTSQIGGNLNAVGGSSVSFQSWANTSNASPLPAPATIPAGSVTPGPHGPFGPGAYTSTLATTFNRGVGPYSLFVQTNITLIGGGSLGFNGLATVEGQPVSPDARITITPDATNEVGQTHTFIATVEQDDGLAIGTPGGDPYNGFGPAVGANTTVNLANQNGATTAPTSFTGTTDANGQFPVAFTSATAGQVIGNATTTLIVSGQPLMRDTDPATTTVAGPGGSGPATKTFVDAKISITPNATNEVGQPHTFTVTVMQDDGLTAAQGGDGVTGFTAATVGNVDVTLTDSNGAARY